MGREALDAAVVLDPRRGDLSKKSGGLRLFVFTSLGVLQGLSQDPDAPGLFQLHDALENAADGAQGPEGVDPDLADVDADLDQDSNPAVLGDESAQVVALQRQGGDDVDGRSEAGLGFGGRKGFNAQLKQIN